MGTPRLTLFLLRTAVLPLWAAGHAMAHHLPPGMEEIDEFAEPSFASAVMHPFCGADHWLVALAVGLSAWSWGKKTGLQSTSLFVLAMAGGMAAGRAGFHLPMMETGLAVSVILGGCVVAGARWVSAQAVLVLAALTGAWHGVAHGLEWPATASAPDASGLVLGSALIAFSAVLLASRLPTPASRPALPRWAGRGLAAAGAALLAVSFAS